uniref:Uncharacterized protein n=1 Tax=Anguilla anguilla TaxID=7936 RepID=A0A0E9QIA9_ANGAN
MRIVFSEMFHIKVRTPSRKEKKRQCDQWTQQQPTRMEKGLFMSRN